MKAQRRKGVIAVFDEQAEEYDRWYHEEPRASLYELEVKAVKLIQGTAKFLPIREESFDYVLSILTICFLEDVGSSFREVWRVLKQGESAIICFILRDSYLGFLCLRKKAEGHRFYKYASLYDKE